MTKQLLKEYCDAEFENIESVLAEIALVVIPGKTKYTTAELAAVATFIHNCYNGVENIFKRIISFSSAAIKESPTWHKDMLKTALELNIISSDLYDALSTYLSFRHFFVHAYSFTLRWEELKPLVENLDDTLRQFQTSVTVYISMFD